VSRKGSARRNTITMHKTIRLAGCAAGYCPRIEQTIDTGDF